MVANVKGVKKPPWMDMDQWWRHWHRTGHRWIEKCNVNVVSALGESCGQDGLQRICAKALRCRGLQWWRWRQLHWKGVEKDKWSNLRSSQRRNAIYILSRVFLRQRIVLDSYTSSCSFGPCFGLFMIICTYSAQQIRCVVHWQLSLALFALPIVIRRLGMNVCMNADIILLLFAHSEGLVWPLTQTFRGHFDAQYRSSSFGWRVRLLLRSHRLLVVFLDTQYGYTFSSSLPTGSSESTYKPLTSSGVDGRWPRRWWPGCTFTPYIRCCPFV